MKKVLVFLPLFCFLLIAGFFYYALEVRKERPVSELASALIDRPFPDFELMSLSGETVTRDDLVTGEVTLVNVWGSWCVACRAEHPYLSKISADGVRIIGVNYKDKHESAVSWLNQYGDISEFHIVDQDGRLGINLGVYGAPETYLIDAQGFIRYKRVGVIDDKEWAKIEPIYKRLSLEATKLSSETANLNSERVSLSSDALNKSVAI